MNYKCGHCGYEGPCYGCPTSKGVSAPWCPQCQRNDQLIPIEGTKGGIATFHAHLDVCSQCRHNPFGLCATGAELLKKAAIGP